ncbi:VOC family protein [Geomonas sp. Red69]|uniref:VOC family protein n=1 Tax=Geomonas diazotrophica TaxID=2843197 RepID=UPI001C1114D4|nr:VOC family protein [Geomonas diazotrophica]MBU5636372.1 VOC family protein [Geomonas diazotrophica]
MISRIDHLNIVVRDLEAAAAFFALLGFTPGISSVLDTDFLEKLTGVRCAGGKFTALHHPGSDLSIELLQFDAGGDPDAGVGIANRIGMRHLAFAVTDIDAEVARLRGHGVQFIGEVQVWQKTGKKLIYFYGPEGILLELAQYPKP